MSAGRRVAIVTGGNRGLGRGTAEALARRGLRVVLAARDLDKARAAVAALKLADPELDLHPAACDVTDDAACAALIDGVLAEHGRLDVLVNNAGAIVEGSGDPLAVGAETIARTIDINALGAWRLIRRALPAMNAAGYGRVVDVSSGMGGLSEMGPGWPGYRISKAALNAVTVMGHHAAGAGVKVNAVCPGWVRTDMGGSSATRSVDEGIVGIVWAATLPADGPSGGFFRDGEPIAW